MVWGSVNVSTIVVSGGSTPPTPPPTKYYTVTFSVDQSKGTSSGSTQIVVEEGGSATPPTVVAKTGWTFAGWSSQAYRNVTSNCTINATFTAVEYTISYDLDGKNATNPNTQTKYTIQDSFTPVAPQILDAGYTFTHWTPSSITSPSTGNVTFLAGWQAKEVEVQLDFDDGTGSSSTIAVTYGQVPPDVVPPTREGYDFDGYYAQ